jgi:hypothetical protein
VSAAEAARIAALRELVRLEYESLPPISEVYTPEKPDALRDGLLRGFREARS